MEWTDKRLDDFTERVSDDLQEIKGDIRALDAKIDDRFSVLDVKIEDRFGVLDAKIDDKVDGLHVDMKADFRHLDVKLNALLVAMIVGVLSVIGAGIAAVGGG